MIHLRAGDWHGVIAPQLGGSLLALRWRGRDALRSNESALLPTDAGCFPMLPFCGRVRGGEIETQGGVVRLPRNDDAGPNALHGFGWSQPWRIVAQDVASCTLEHRDGSGSWPWPYAARLRYAADRDMFRMELEIINCGDHPMPAGLGFHPYFPRDSHSRICASAAAMDIMGADKFPCRRVTSHPVLTRLREGGAPGDDIDTGFYNWTGSAQLVAALPVLLTSDLDRFVIFAPAGASFFCFEPVSHDIGAFSAPAERWVESGLSMLAPGAKCAAFMTLRMPPPQGDDWFSPTAIRSSGQ